MRCSAASVAYRLLAVPVASVFCRKFEEIFADSKYRCIFAVPIGKPNAEIAQLVERNLAKVEVAGPSPVFRSKITTATMVVVFRIRQSLPRPLCFPTIPVSPTLHPYFPHLTHREQKPPSTQLSFPICYIGSKNRLPRSISSSSVTSGKGDSINQGVG